MDAIRDWAESDANEEYFYLEEDEEKGGKAHLSVAGRFSFTVDVKTLHVECSDVREPVKKWLEGVRKMPHEGAVGLLNAATKKYQEVSDELDALEEGSESDDECDGMVDDIPVMVAEEGNKKTPEMIEKERQFEELLTKFDTSKGNKAATDRILSDYKSIFLSKTKFGWDATPHKGDLYSWDIRLFDFEKGTPLYDDMKKLKSQTQKDYVEMLLTFPAEYPFKPPFLRIIRPRFQFHTGRVTIGGSICHELLTNKGWKPVNDIESIIETIRAEITDPEAKARLDFSITTDYQESEARQAFERTAQRYGWN
eukprot:TRINITY_DN4286_c0_g1_i1.p1 TRINITY_DN4286_c0_g1~~TRINITY_DN4286_c0_g1_i1.p1  ORF type:complete len:310 (+),score=108.27 TRINITY_DN4286_c0_g1_i1:47-976(+)